ncbi:MAG: hypothetical protein HOJ97_02430 [Alphaproteobacteria bacterium]|nr:hypothetical protein [Alphaproteobacteria bacterium]
MTKKFLITLFSILFMLSTAYADRTKDKTQNLQGSGAGGQILINNDTDRYIYVTWSGTGCAGIKQGLSLVCENAKIESGGSQLYKYNWGVTTTWINVADFLLEGGVSACSPLAAKSVQEEHCLADHHVVKTKAHKTNTCDVAGHPEYYSVDCYR